MLITLLQLSNDKVDLDRLERRVQPMPAPAVTVPPDAPIVASEDTACDSESTAEGTLSPFTY